MTVALINPYHKGFHGVHVLADCSLLWSVLARKLHGKLA